MTGFKADAVKEQITQENVITLLNKLGSDTYTTDNYGNLIFKTVCHNGNSHKLYYYKDSKIFTCYTNCGCFDIFELVVKTMGCSFVESLSYVAKMFGVQCLQSSEPERESDGMKSDWELFEKYKFLSEKKEEAVPEVKIYDSGVLNYFTDGLHESWVKDGITHESAKKFGIKYDTSNNRIIIPHKSIDGELIGIRVRNLEERAVESGVKYMPLTLQGDLYNHSLGANLYGIHENLSAIKRHSKIVLFESEKSVLQCESFYPNNNFAVATCGGSITNAQKSLILSLKIREVFIAFDKEYQSAFSPESDAYADRIIKLAKKFSLYVNTYVLWDTEGILSYKDSPSDKGVEVLERLMKNKFPIG